MIPRVRGLRIGDFDTAVDGRMTMTKYALETPDFVSDWQDIPGMDGSIDFTEAVAGRAVFKTRKLTATFELSAENFRWREQMIDQMIEQLHGKRLEIHTPDVANESLIGRISVKKNFNRLRYAEISVTAVCDPFYTEDYERMELVYFLQRTDNKIVYENTSYLSAYSTAPGSVSGDTEMKTVTLCTAAAAVGTVACFRVELQASKKYYVSGRFIGHGSIRVSKTLSPMPDTFDPVITTGSTGYLYIWITRLQADHVVNLDDVVVVPAEQIKYIDFGQIPILPDYTRPGSAGLTGRAIISINGRNYVHNAGYGLRTELLSGPTPVAAFRTDTSENTIAEIIRFRGKRL